ncbi:MAG TPA: gliding motility protein GldC [Chitinophagaceae bacterium]|nr:gliding motility protein GldC [Chitinophagaceae bacterium]
MAKTSEIKINVKTSDKQIPEEITWNASDSTADMKNKARAMMLSFWEPQEKNALRIDLWTEEMMMDEMAEFFFQTFVGMAETFENATQFSDQAQDIRRFAEEFLKKFQSRQESADIKSPL